jgi:hypothetical protein
MQLYTMKQTTKKSIALVICYIGKLPWYFDYFAHSCKFNTTVDFFIITDDKSYSKLLPANVKIIHRTLDEINSSATEKLGLLVQISNGYKLCDFKPTYGILFSELLQGYDFWGHGDIDVVFGDIRNFITEEILHDYDMISVRHDFLTGQFLLFKNNERMNSLFTLSRDYKRVLCSEQHYCFDETNFQWQGFTEGKPYCEIPCEVESMTHLVKRLAHENYLNAHFDFLIVEGIPGKLKWERGRLFYKNKYEILLYHLVLFKKVYQPKKRAKSIPDVFTISPTKIYH